MFISAPSQAVLTVWDFKVLVKGIKAVSQSAMCRHTCVIPSSPALLASTKPSLPALKSCHTFFMMARAAGSGLVRNSACRGTVETNTMLSIYHGRQGQIWWSRPDRDRFKQQHQQPVCVCCDPDGWAICLQHRLTEWDSASTRPGKMALGDGVD